MRTLEQLAAALPPLPARLLAGVSGGADSVALLLLLTRLPGHEIAAVHVNHGLRGDASDGDEAFVRALCERLHVPLLVYRAEPPQNPGEDWARQARYGFFREAMAHSGAEALVLAHHRDDQAETLLLHLLRGAGLTGLAGMSPRTVREGMTILRPLLDFSREELRAALTECGQAWREDASNADPRYLRNAVRGQLLPLMETLAPGASARIAATAALLGETNAAAMQQTERFLDTHAGHDWLAIAPVQALPVGARAAILRRWWQRALCPETGERSLDRAQTAALAALLDAPVGARCNLPDRRTAQRGWHCLHLLPAAPNPPVDAIRAKDGAHMCGVTLTLAPFTGAPGDGALAQAIPTALLADCELRTRRSGDWLRPFGQTGRQSLQDYFTNRRVDAPMRDRVPLLCRGSEVLLAAGVGAGDIPRCETGEGLVLLRWQGDMPWTIK